MTIRVMVVDDQALVRAGLVGIVNTAPDMHVVGEAGNGDEAVRSAVTTRPDVILMDVRMPGTDGLAATATITSTTTARVIVLTTFDIDEYVYAALRGGASGFLVKDTPPVELLTAIRAVAAGGALLSPGVTRRLIDQFARRTSPQPDTGAEQRRILEATTERQREVLALIGAGLTNDEISQRLHISAGTTKTHIGNLLAKLDARDRVQLVILAHRADLLADPQRKVGARERGTT
ncbi:MAG: response regulator transcription factor [Marmoricola sp.]